MLRSVDALSRLCGAVKEAGAEVAAPDLMVSKGAVSECTPVVGVGVGRVHVQHQTEVHDCSLRFTLYQH